MNQVPDSHWTIWESGQFVGVNYPNCRVLVSNIQVSLSNGGYRTHLFSDQADNTQELTGLKTINIDRRIGGDAATLQLVAINNKEIDVDEDLDASLAGTSRTRRRLGQLGDPGYKTFSRGTSSDHRNRWGQELNEWRDMLLPNRVIFTFQGYGTDGATRPEDDANLTLTGVWLIDTVEFRADGTILLNARDAAKLLLEQKLFPPLLPIDRYPFDVYGPDYEQIPADIIVNEPEPEVTSTTPVLSPNYAKHVAAGDSWPYDSSVSMWGSNGHNKSIYGHTAAHAFDGDETTFWMSNGYSDPDGFHAFPWIDARCNGNWVNQVRFKPWRGLAGWNGVATRFYISFNEEAGAWLGSNRIPYVQPSGVNAYKHIANNTPYVYTGRISNSSPKTPGEGWEIINLPWYPDVKRAHTIRLSFRDFPYTAGEFPDGPYHAGLYEFVADSLTVPAAQPPGETEYIVIGGPIGPEDPVRIEDYTELVKLFCAWGGFYWPGGSPDDNLLTRFGSTGDIESGQESNAPVPGRVWGDFMATGAYPVDPPEISGSYWEGLSPLEAINKLREITGFIFYVDSHGGVIWRSPNIWKLGNYQTFTGWTDFVPEITEDNVLLDYGITIDDVNLRSRILIVSENTSNRKHEEPFRYAEYIPGFATGERDFGPTLKDTDILSGQERVMTIGDFPFQSEAEMDKFAFLTSLWIHWSLRKTKFRIPGIAAFEPDDQIKIYERVTSESYVHYILGLSSSMDLDAGTWTMDIDTHWLGTSPEANWIVTKNDLENAPALYAWLIAVGILESDNPIAATYDFRPPVFEPQPIRVNNVVFPPAPEFDFPLYEPQNMPQEEDQGIGYVVGNALTRGSQEWAMKYWGRFSSCDNNPAAAKQLTQTALVPWKSAYAGLPVADVKSHSSQTQTIRLQSHEMAWQVWDLLFELIKEFEIPITQASSFACRKINPATGNLSANRRWSSHSWGISLDLNWNTSGWGLGDYPSDQAKQLGQAAETRIDFGTKNGGHPDPPPLLVRWGGNWSTAYRDPMHFEIYATSWEINTYGVVLSA